MKIFIAFFSYIIIFNCIILPQKSEERYITNEYLIEDYKDKKYASEYEKIFKTESDRQNFKKLRDYRKRIRDILQLVEDTYTSRDLNKLSNIKDIDNYINKYKNEIKNKSDNEEINVNIILSDPYIDYYEKFTVEHIRNNILTQLEEIRETATEQDSIRKVQRDQLKENMKLLQADLSRCENQLDITLAPEYKEQSFRLAISITFAILIGILLIIFFLIIYLKSESRIVDELLGGAGLQFITLFILIISITLFGILGILEGRELAAILSGISGYILGRGIKSVKDVKDGGGRNDKDQGNKE